MKSNFLKHRGIRRSNQRYRLRLLDEQRRREDNITGWVSIIITAITVAVIFFFGASL